MVKLTKVKNKQPKVKQIKQGKQAKNKQSFDFEAFKRSFQTLDTQNIGTWPVVVKVTVALFIVVVILALTYALPVSKKIDDIESAENEQKTLLDEYRQKESKARQLKAYKDQLAQMEVKFQQLIDQLPKETLIPNLLEDINMTGVGSNIIFRDIKVEGEIKKEFFIEQPIRIEAIGDYHEFGSFISGLAALPRIMTVHDFTVKNSKPEVGEIPELNLTLQVKTYRSIDNNQGGQ